MYTIELNDLCRNYAVHENGRVQERCILKGVNLRVKKGEIYGLVGKNGAGKTTLIKIIATLLLPTSGNVVVNGYDVIKDESKVRQSIGVVLSNNRALYLKLTAWENMEFFSDLYMLPKTEQKAKIESLLQLVDLLEWKDEYVENFSHGMMQRLNIVRALLPSPELLILDEPTNGLDLESTNELRKIILMLNRRGKTILLTTHSLEEIDILATRMGILKAGKIVKEGIPRDLKKKFGRKIFEISIGKTNAQKNIERLEELFQREMIVKSDSRKDHILVHFSGSKEWNIEYIMKELKREGLESNGITCKEASLEDIFFHEIRGE